MRILLTGTTGFLGGYLVRAASRRHEVRVLARPSSRVEALEAAGLEVVRASFEEAGTLREATRGVDVIVHAAGGGMARRVEDLYLANTASTRALLGAATGRVRRFVLVSSLAAHGPAEPGRPASEADGDAPRSHYGRSKLAAERALFDADIEGVAVRPPALYGPGDHRLLPLFRGAQRGVVPMVHPEGTLSLLHAADCAEAIVRALEVEEARGVYFVAERRIYGRREMAELIARAVGRRARVLAIPPETLRAVAGGAELVGTLRAATPTLTFDKVRDVVEPHQCCDPTRAIEELDWSPTHDFETGAREMAEDYRARSEFRLG